MFKSSVIATDALGALLIELIRNHIPRSTLIIENNSYGKAVIDHITNYIPRNIYSHKVYPQKGKIKGKEQARGPKVQVGISTTTSTRPLMMDTLKEIVSESMHCVAYEELYQEIKGLQYGKNGKIEHSARTHDDVVMAMLIVRYAFKHTNNIAEYFGDMYYKSKRSRNSIVDPTKTTGPEANMDEILALIHNGLSMEEALKQYAESELKHSNGKKINRSLLASVTRK